MKVRYACVSILMIFASIAAPGGEPVKPVLRFAWPEMTCTVKQRRERSNSRKPVESLYTMTSTRIGENLRVSFLGFQVIDTFPEVPERARANFLEAEYVLGRGAVERVFDVTTSGAFVHAESHADVDTRIKASGKAPPFFIRDDQERLNAKYLQRWRDFMGNWAGFETPPGGSMQLKVPHPGDETWLNYDVPTDVTISAPIDCVRGGKQLRCVTIRTRFSPAYAKPGESDANSTRHEDSSEIVLEPDTMIPHSWMEEVKYRGGSLDGNLSDRYTRSFECDAGS